MERKFEYIGVRGRSCDIVTVGSNWFDYRKGEDELPNVGAFCRTCGKETAKPVYPIYMNGNPAYALRCDKCCGEYPMYKSMFIQRYVGHTTKSGGRINPTHGLMSPKTAMDRKARDEYNAIPKKVEDEICESFGYSHEEYKKVKQKWEENSKRARKEFENEMADIRAQIRDEKIQKESDNRKELIAKGILKYVKNVGLVNTETGQIVKL